MTNINNRYDSNFMDLAYVSYKESYNKPGKNIDKKQNAIKPENPDAKIALEAFLNRWTLTNWAIPVSADKNFKNDKKCVSNLKNIQRFNIGITDYIKGNMDVASILMNAGAINICTIGFLLTTKISPQDKKEILHKISEKSGKYKLQTYNGLSAAIDVLNKDTGFNSGDIKEIVLKITDALGKSTSEAFYYLDKTMAALNTAPGFYAKDKKEILIKIAEKSKNYASEAYNKLSGAMAALNTEPGFSAKDKKDILLGIAKNSG
ncbi:MAG: hypothetical protein ABIH39_03355, partial [Candidatus Margulisiibacteriota bacterium]